jgi:hypothetical protein
MKLSTINESTDITGKLDPLISKYDELRIKATDEMADLHYELIVDNLRGINTIEGLKKFLKTIHNSLNNELNELNKIRSMIKPKDTFEFSAFESRMNSYNRAITTYEDIINFGKSVKFW